MSKINLYHGSNKIIEKPIYHFEGSSKHNDYGLGFYLTRDKESGKEWANKSGIGGILNIYKIDDRSLLKLDLTDKSKYSVLNWIAILLHFRILTETFKETYHEELKYLEKYYIDVDKYDIIIGYRADDSYFKFPRSFIEGDISYEKLEEVYLLGDLGLQYVIKSKKAFDKISFIDCEYVDDVYYENYKTRIENANKSFEHIKLMNRNNIKTSIKDLIKNDKNI